MKNSILQFIIGCICISTYAQFGPQQIIDGDAFSASKAIPYDVNSDGFIDIITKLASENSIVWYQNLDGLGNFGGKQSISNNIPAILNLEMYDLNSDGLKDIVYNTNLNKIAWLENIDGLGTFGIENILFQGSYCYSFSIADKDGDGDNDVFANLYASGEANRISWFENIDGLGDFSDEFLIEEGEFYGDGGGSILLNFDLDDDGDNDLITSYEGYLPSQLIWYENIDGQGNLSSSQELYQFQISPFNQLSDWRSISSLGYTDINDDNKIDLIASTFFTDGDFFAFDIVWLENLNGQGAFSNPQNIHNTHTYLMNFYDLDNDGDMDILQGYGNFISWFKNLDGLGNFSEQIIINNETESIRDVRAADFNGDGLLDIVSASAGDNKIAWYQNLGDLGISESTLNNFKIYPNPTNEVITISSNEQISTIEIYNVIGQKISETKNGSEVNLSHFETGIYFIKIMDDSENSETHKIIKE